MTIACLGLKVKVRGQNVASATSSVGSFSCSLQLKLSAVSYDSYLMTAHHLTLNASETALDHKATEQNMAFLTQHYVCTLACNLSLFSMNIQFSQIIFKHFQNPAFHELHCMCRYIDSRTASSVTASIIYSKLDYCNSLYYKLPWSQFM